MRKVTKATYLLLKLRLYTLLSLCPPIFQPLTTPRKCGHVCICVYIYVCVCSYSILHLTVWRQSFNEPLLYHFSQTTRPRSLQDPCISTLLPVTPCANLFFNMDSEYPNCGLHACSGSTLPTMSSVQPAISCNVKIRDHIKNRRCKSYVIAQGWAHHHQLTSVFG